MTPGEWAQIKCIFDAAVELPQSERSGFLTTACAGQLQVLAEVQSLLGALEDAGDFIESPAPGRDRALTDLAADPAFRTGMSIGPYRIVQAIGEGGMGMVYQAVRVDDLYRKLVALKVVRRGLYSGVAIRRFETERHILAHLDHPNIAKLLDGGTTADGQPFFVMDFIAGTPIDEYCENERLSLRRRLELFLTVCSAVQYAHQNFVVHRDIKPQNILVTAEGAIRLLDFGIAKLLDPEAEGAGETMSVIQMMTPEYASPEQLHNQPVTTASDTYSLGVLLYVILTGHRPFVFKTRSVQEICDVIRDSEPRRPSGVVRMEETTANGRVLTEAGVAASRRLTPAKLARELTGDLDNILLMALRREPARRYVSVEQLAGDIERYLSGRPVVARHDTFAYRSAKFMRRHQGAVLAASLAVFVLIAGTITTSWEARDAMRERERAERRFNDVRRVANSLLFDVYDAIRDVSGSEPARQLIVTKAREFLDNLAQDSDDDRPLERELAAAWERVGDVQAQSPESSPEGVNGALGSYRKALSIRERLAVDAPSDPEVRRELLPTYGKLSDLLWSAGDSAASMNYSRKLVALSEQLAAGPGATRQDRLRLATSNLDYGYKLGTVAGDPVNGLASCRKSLAIFHELSAADPKDRRLLRVLSIADDRTAELLEKVPSEPQPRSREEAMKLRQASLAIKNGLLHEEPLNADYRRLTAWGHYDLGRLINADGDPNQALAQFQLALEAFQQLSLKDPTSVQSRRDLAMGRIGVASAWLKLNRFREARSWYRLGLPTLMELNNSGDLQKDEAPKVEEAKRELEQCERALPAR
jgi:serine/threonine protein kinase/tetratricopeptide (TPR) repeat protein